MVDSIVTKNWRDLIKPRGLTVDQESLSNTYGKFVAEPLERGFGITLGNSLRRVLLSSLQGAAITSVKIEGVEHEFMTIPEVAEDVTDIILNLKEVLLQIHTNEVKTIRIVFTSLVWIWRRTSLRFRMMSVTSSATSGIVMNSCSTPSIFTEVMAAPCSDESSTRRNEFPRVMPNPRSSGSATNFP